MLKFTPFRNWLMEAKKTQSKKIDYGCVMLYAESIPSWDKYLGFIDKKDIYDDKFKDYGLEHTPHCTLLFGIHLDKTNTGDIKKFISTFKPIEVVINEISTFKNDVYDVVKFDVPVIPELKKYHEALKANYPNTQDFPAYHPHMTIGYVLPGTGKKYAKPIKHFKVKFDTVVYSFKSNGSDKQRIKVKLGNE